MLMRIYGLNMVGVKYMNSRVLKPDIDPFCGCSDDDNSDDGGGIRFNDIEEERDVEVDAEEFVQVEVDRPGPGTRINVNGKSFRFKKMASKDPKKTKDTSRSPKVNVLVPKSVMGSSSRRNNVGSKEVDYDSEELNSSDLDDYPKD